MAASSTIEPFDGVQLQPIEQRDRGRQRLLDVLEDRGRRPRRQRPLLQAQAGDGGRLKVPTQPVGSPVRRERRERTGSRAGARRQQVGQRLGLVIHVLARHQALGRPEPDQLGGQQRAGRRASHLGRRELPGADVHARQPRPAPLDDGSRQKVVGPGRQQAVLDQRARRDDADDLAPDQPPRRHLADLVADRHPVPLLDQPGDVPLGGVVRHAGHRDALAPADVAARQHDVERLRHDLRVVVERLVEVAQAEEEDGVRMARLDLQVLPTDRVVGRYSGPSRLS